MLTAAYAGMEVVCVECRVLGVKTGVRGVYASVVSDRLGLTRISREYVVCKLRWND